MTILGFITKQRNRHILYDRKADKQKIVAQKTGKYPAVLYTAEMR